MSGPLSHVPAEEWVTDASLVRQLLREQARHLAELPVERAFEGWDNVSYRLGTDWLVRMVRRSIAVDCIANEQRWLPVLAPTLPVPVPAPVVLGQPTETFPHPWSVVPWFPGDNALVGAIDGAAVAAQLAAFFRALHMPAPDEAPYNPFRSVWLAERRARLWPVLETFDDGTLRRHFEAGCVAEQRHRPRTWLHGDTHPGNLLVADGQIAAVLDWGDVCYGDPASDLCCAWMLFDAPDREAFFAAYGADAETVVRARAWAVQRAGLMAAVTDNPEPFAAMVRRTVDRLRAE